MCSASNCMTGNCIFLNVLKKLKERCRWNYLSASSACIFRKIKKSIKICLLMNTGSHYFNLLEAAWYHQDRPQISAIVLHWGSILKRHEIHGLKIYTYEIPQLWKITVFAFLFLIWVFIFTYYLYMLQLTCPGINKTWLYRRKTMKLDLYTIHSLNIVVLYW